MVQKDRERSEKDGQRRVETRRDSHLFVGEHKKDGVSELIFVHHQHH